MGYRIAIYGTTGDSTTQAVLMEGDMVVRGWSKRINAAGRMTFSIHKGHMKATSENFRKYRRVRLYRNTVSVWFGYIEATKQVGDQMDVLCVGMLDLFKKRYTGANENFNGQGSTEAFGLLTDTNANDGATGISSGIGGVTSTKDLTLDSREILRAWEELARAHSAEFEIDDAGDFNFVSSLGTDQSSTQTFQFRQDGSSGGNVERIWIGEDGKPLANKVVGTSTSGVGFTSTKNDATSQNTYGVLIERKAFNEANNQATLDSMTQSYLNQRASPAADLRIEPTLASKKFNPVSGNRELSGLEYGDVVVGDLVTVDIVTPNRTISTAKRIAEVKMFVDENAKERMELVLTESGVFITADYLDADEIEEMKRKIKEYEQLV